MFEDPLVSGEAREAAEQSAKQNRTCDFIYLNLNQRVIPFNDTEQRYESKGEKKTKNCHASRSHCIVDFYWQTDGRRPRVLQTGRWARRP